MRLVRTVVGLPHGIVLAFIIVTPLRANITAGFVRLVHKWLVAVCIVPRAANQEKFTTVLAEVCDVVLLQSVEEIIVQKRAEIVIPSSIAIPIKK